MKRAKFSPVALLMMAMAAVLICFLFTVAQPEEKDLKWHAEELRMLINQRKEQLAGFTSAAASNLSRIIKNDATSQLWKDDYFVSTLDAPFSLLILYGDSALFWNKSLSSDYSVLNLQDSIGISPSDAGLLIYSSALINGYRIIASEYVYRSHPIENPYLEQGFTEYFHSLSGKIKIINTLYSESESLTIPLNNVAVHISYADKDQQTDSNRNPFNADLFIFLFLFFGVLLHRELTVRKGKGQINFNNRLNIAYWLGQVFIAVFMAIVQMNSDQSFLSEPGGLLTELLKNWTLTSGFVYLMLWFGLTQWLANDAMPSLRIQRKFLAALLTLLFVPLTTDIISHKIIENIDIQIDGVYISGLNNFSFSYFAALSIVAIAGIHAIAVASVRIFMWRDKLFPQLLLIVFILLFHLSTWYFESEFFTGSLLAGLMLISSFLPLSKTLAYLRKFSYLLAWFAVSTGLAFMLTHQGGKLADNEQLLTAKKLSADKDPMLEFLFPDLAAAWANDSTLNRMVFRKETEDQEINSYIRNTYLSGYLSKYETELTTCLTTQNLLIQPENRMMNCIEYFRSLAALRGDSLKPNGLFLLENNLLGVHYVGYLILTNRSGQQTDSLHLFVEFYFKYIPEGTGYPDLLIDSRKGIGPDLNKYSFASYRNGVLYYKFGGYFYPLRLDQITTADDGFFCREGFRHAILKYDDKTLIISRKEQSWAETLAPFSFFLLINGLLLTLMVWVANGFPDFRKTFVTFRTRLQLIISVSLIASFTVIGIISAIYLADIYRKKNDDFLAEKTQSLIVELEHKLKDLPLEAGSMRDYLNQILLKFSMVFFTDINLYGVDGKLLATSRPEIFAMGLTGDLMHPGAFRAMRLQNRLYLRQYEEIGKARFISSYAPFKNTDGEIIAFVNLPYFVRESEMQREISSILLSYLNIFLLLSSVSLLFALFVSRRLTQPLQMIQQKMSKLQLGHTNEKIQYQRFDEIGELVNQYNTLLDQLAASAELLARSERESAWREMARQVAHEIKNPLTPMRLSVQYLIRALDNNDPDIDQKIRNISQTLISQIDTLSSIASSFSDFAVMPQPKPVKLDLSEVLQKIVNLFDHQENITFGLQISASTPAWIEADPENLNRIFINLIKNSIQAIGNKPQARITVRLSESTTAYLVEVEDTGKGMTEEEARKVFSPNFTTKSSGMGMGLSIVHSLVQQAGGKIDFNTRPGQGTTFQIELPRAASPA